MFEKIYTARATTTGGRSGHIKSENGELDVDVRLPKTPGNYLNPEILFAGGYSACFDNAIIETLRQKKIRGAIHSTTIQVSLGKLTETTFGFEIVISVKMEGVDQSVAEEVVTQAHQVCPYSNATRGNVEVTLVVNESEIKN